MLLVAMKDLTNPHDATKMASFEVLSKELERVRAALAASRTPETMSAVLAVEQTMTALTEERESGSLTPLMYAELIWAAREHDVLLAKRLQHEAGKAKDPGAQRSLQQHAVRVASRVEIVAREMDEMRTFLDPPSQLDDVKRKVEEERQKKYTEMSRAWLRKHAK
jgi:hypothetical protein